MAETLTTYDFDKPSILTTNRTRTYPWGQWFDGRIWRITRGVDFDAQTLMMERIIRSRASNQHVSLRLRHEDESTIVFQASKRVPNAAAVSVTPAVVNHNVPITISHTPRSKTIRRPTH